MTTTVLIMEFSLNLLFVFEFARDQSRPATFQGTSHIRPQPLSIGRAFRKAYPSLDELRPPGFRWSRPFGRTLQLSADAVSNSPALPEWRATRALPLRQYASHASLLRLSSRCSSILFQSIASSVAQVFGTLLRAKRYFQSQDENRLAVPQEKPQNESDRR